MKLHFNADATSQASIRKLRSVIQATESKVQEVPYKGQDNVSQLSAFNSLPLLETQDGTFFSSNTIARYLATVNKSQLYGNGNLHHQALVDQWLDLITCDFEASVRAVSQHQNGDKVDFGKLMGDVNKFLDFIEKQLTERKFLVGQSFSLADIVLASNVSVVFEFMFGEGQRKKFAHVLSWYSSVATTYSQVGPVQLPKQAHEAFTGGKKEAKPAKEGKEAKGGKKEQTKQETKKAEDDDDLFGDDTSAPTQPAPKPQPAKPKKEKPAAKSIVVFDVKVYEQETDLQKLFQKVKTITKDGLVWNSEPQFIQIAYGMKKLQVGCVVEDAKVSLEDIFEEVEGWEEVQSTDTVSFQKL